MDPLAQDVIARLQRDPEARHVVLGGHFALRCYLDYRTTHDIDGWWAAGITLEERGRTRTAIERVAREVAQGHSLTIRERSWGETQSLDFHDQTASTPRTVFSIQIADRTVELEPPTVSPWPPIPIETLADNLGSKMNALVFRGAPRDFRDVREVVRAELVTTAECWELWQAKNPSSSVESAKEEVVRHLEEIELRRPLERVPDADRPGAAELRQWVRDELASGLDRRRGDEGREL